jgi:ABC-type Fe3+-siderophore transport system permease subunit
MDKQIFKWEFLGFLVTFGLGAMLHFVFEWSGYWPPVALFGAVNESTWEHLKMAFWPMMLWLLVEGMLIKKRHIEVRNFVIAKAIGTYVTPLTIIVLFNAYLAIGFTSSLASGLAFFAIGVFAGYLVSAIVMSSKQWPKAMSMLGIGLLAFATFCFSMFTFFPPQNFLFLDPSTGLYGILS